MESLIEQGKALIRQGIEIGDPDIVQMGRDLLAKYQPAQEQRAVRKEFVYSCLNCAESCEFDKPRKQCPHCKKHKLAQHSDLEPQPTIPEVPLHRQATNFDEFFGIIHQKDEEVAIKRSSIDPNKVRNTPNKFQPDLVSDEGHDPQNEALKKYTRQTPRERDSVANKVKLTCRECNRQELVPPHWNTASEGYICAKCVSRKG